MSSSADSPSVAVRRRRFLLRWPGQWGVVLAGSFSSYWCHG